MNDRYDVTVTCVAATIGETGKERYEFLCMKAAEMTNVLLAKFKKLAPLEWKIYLGPKVAEIHHNSHTWCFCDYDAVIKRINESEEPTYLGMMGKFKAWQNNKLQPNEVVLEGSFNGETHRAKLVIEE